MKKEQRIDGFVSAIQEWYETHKRTLPWRDMAIEDDTERAYRVMVSEIMLQQTQVSRVIIVFRNFIERFPSINDLANASNADVIMAWRGMGYNSRALRLRDAAQKIVTEYSGVFPRDYDQLLSIKGLGPYTVGAIRNFAFNIPTPCIDTNIRRILHRTFFGAETIDGSFAVSDKALLDVAQTCLDCALLHDFDARNWHAALMDYGSLIQTKTSPKWHQCILTDRHIMVCTPENWIPPVRGMAKEKLKKEPGRMVGSTYIPNRIFRGRIVEALRDTDTGLSAEEIGPIICIDWNDELREWLDALVQKLVHEKILAIERSKYVLHQ